MKMPPTEYPMQPQSMDAIDHPSTKPNHDPTVVLLRHQSKQMQMNEEKKQRKHAPTH